MTRSEAAQLLRAMADAWPAAYRRMDEDAALRAVDTWHRALCDIKLADAQGALEKLVRTSRYAPNPAELHAAMGSGSAAVDGLSLDALVARCTQMRRQDRNWMKKPPR